jgi:long-chain fatty acid transport protein
MKKHLTLKLLPAALLAAYAGGGHAAGFQLLEQNASGIGNAYAGSAAVAENASTIFFNPAGMTGLQAREVSLGVAAVRPNFKFSDTGSSNAPTAVGTNDNGGGDFVLVPNAYGAMQINPDLYVGIGVSAPFGLVTEYDDGWAGRFQSTKFEIKTVNLNPSLAYRVNDTVSVGGGLNYQKLDATYERFVSAGNALVPALTNAALQTTKIALNADDTALGWNVGAIFEPSAGTRFGVSYRSKVKYSLEGSLTSSNPAVVANVGASADLELPDTLIVSATHRLNQKFELLADVSWTGWSSIEKVNIVRTTSGGTATTAAGTIAQTLDANFRDTWRVALGANMVLDDAWKLKFGVAYDQTPVRSDAERLVSLPDNDRLWLSVGAQWKPAKHSAVDVGLAYLQVDDTKIDNDQSTSSPLQAASNRGRVTGTYDSDVVILGVQYSQSF